MTNTVFNTVSFAEYELKEESYNQNNTKKISL